MLEKVGQAGIDGFVGAMLKRQADSQRPFIVARDLSRIKPDFITTVEKQYSNRPWGFIIYRMTAYGDDDGWKSFRSRFDASIAMQFDKVAGRPGVSEARPRFQLRWMEDPTLEGVAIQDVARSVCKP